MALMAIPKISGQTAIPRFLADKDFTWRHQGSSIASRRPAGGNWTPGEKRMVCAATGKPSRLLKNAPSFFNELILLQSPRDQGVKMRQKIVWTAMAVLVGIAIYAYAGAGGSALFLWGYGTAYFLFGIVLLGAVARWWTRGSPALWRPFMLSAGSLGAALEIVSRHGQLAGLPPVDRWMVAVIGLVAAALVARLIPFRFTRFWLGIDRRGHEPGA